MRPATDLRGQRILVVEDDYYLAADTAGAVAQAGAAVIGPSPTERDARQRLEGAVPTAAVLDINLGAGPSFGLAALLEQRGIPFVFVTGYDGDVVPARFAGVPRMPKPVDPAAVVGAVAELLLLQPER